MSLNFRPDKDNELFFHYLANQPFNPAIFQGFRTGFVSNYVGCPEKDSIYYLFLKFFRDIHTSQMTPFAF